MNSGKTWEAPLWWGGDGAESQCACLPACLRAWGMHVVETTEDAPAGLDERGVVVQAQALPKPVDGDRHLVAVRCF